MSRVSVSFRRRLIAGFIVILPLALTAWIAGLIFRFFGRLFLFIFSAVPVLSELPVAAQMLVSFLLTLFLIWLVGVFAKNFVGRALFSWLEAVLLRTPGVSRIYKTVRKISDTMFINKKAFKQAALIEYPRKGLYTMVFVTGSMAGASGEELQTVFVPSTPNPTTGYVIILPESEVAILPITVNQAMEFIFSGGMLQPEKFKIPEIKSNRKRKET